MIEGRRHPDDFPASCKRKRLWINPSVSRENIN
jgi:hypothetical protein